LVRPDNGGIEEGASFIDFNGQLLEEPLPDTSLRPPVEPVVHGLPGAESLRQVSPRDTGPDSPDDCVDEVTVAALGARPWARGEKVFDSQPLSITQLMSAHDKC
jgi:hypothetical protein